MSDPGLFEAAPYHVPVKDEPPETKPSKGVRRTARFAAQLARGMHPIALTPLHPDAAPHDNRKAAGLRCKGCRFHKLFGGHAKDFPKCAWPDPDEYRLSELPRVTNGPATDCRGWYPACTDYEPTPAGTEER